MPLYNPQNPLIIIKFFTKSKISESKKSVMQTNAQQDPRNQILHDECLAKDANATGKISKEQWKEALWAAENRLTDEELAEMERKADQEEGNVNYVTSIPKVQWIE